MFLLAASLLGVQPSKTLVVEDAPAGIQAAKMGGFVVAGLGDAVEEPGTDFPILALNDLCLICSML